VVVENEVATFYVIQPNKTLSPVGDKIKVNTNLFEYDENGNLSLKGFDEATVDTVFVKNADGTLSWKSMVDAYSKTETDEKIKKAVAAASHMRRKIVNDITEIDLDAADADLYIYMVPTSREDSDKYDEYMVITLEDNDGDEVRFIEKIGSWDVNLEDYATKDDLDNKVDKVAGSTLIT